MISERLKIKQDENNNPVRKPDGRNNFLSATRQKVVLYENHPG
jgi:hypothetical protein